MTTKFTGSLDNDPAFFMPYPNITYYLTSFILVISVIGHCQTYSAIYEFDDAQIYEYTDADVYPLNDGNVMVLHTINKPGSDREFDHLVFHEFDSCGVIESRVIEIEQLFGLSRVTDFVHRGDSLVIVARGTSSPGIYPYSEGVLMTLHRETLRGAYRYFRFTQGAIFYNVDFTTGGDFIISGYSSSTMAQPSRFMSLVLDSGYHIKMASQYIPAFTVSTDIRSLPNDHFLIRTSKNIFLTDDQFNIIWNKAFDRPTAGERSIIVSDGVIIPIFGWYGDSELQIIKIDFDGNLVWTSPRLNKELDYDINARLIQHEDGSLIVVSQAYEFNEYEGDIQITRISKTGDIIDQFAVETPKDSNAFQWMREVTYAGGAIWVMMTNLERKLMLYRIDDEYEICGLTDFDYSNNDDYQWLFPADNIEMHDLHIETGKYDIGPNPIEIRIENLCKPEYPLYNLMPDDTLLCDGYSVTIDLEIIPEPVFWHDGSRAKIRTFSDPGTYAYGYGPCQDEFAEMMIIDKSDCTCRVYIPSAFSPNNDGINDRFQIYSPCQLDGFSTLRVFDRWGSKVFESNAHRTFWDGRSDRQLNASGLYIYEFTYEDIGLPEPVKISRSGEVYLID